jgi:hypothetical protein
MDLNPRMVQVGANRLQYLEVDRVLLRTPNNYLPCKPSIDGMRSPAKHYLRRAGFAVEISAAAGKAIDQNELWMLTLP